MLASRPVFVSAYAKLNLTLAVLGRRPDGYHDLSSVFQTVSLCDTLRFEPNTHGELTCGADVPVLNGARNLALRAALLLRETAGRNSLGARIELHKAIPMQGGLGGGSSDAACVLTTLNQLWDLRLPAPALEELGARLGSDVPFFVSGGTSLINGRGEHVTLLPDAEPLWWILAKPAVGIPTPVVFRALTANDYMTGNDTTAMAEAIRAHAHLPFETAANSLERTVLARYPDVATARRWLLDAGAPIVRMSGSGPTLFAPFRSVAQATQVLRQVQRQRLAVWLCHSVSRHTASGALRPDE